MKILISVDIEGIAGICNTEEIWARQAITDDTNAMRIFIGNHFG